MKCFASSNVWLGGLGGVVIAVCAFLFLLSSSAAETDNRTTLDARKKPWSAIGHINIAGYRRRKRCTGTLIGPNLVLTSAHCVFDKTRGKPFKPRNIHFVAGVSRGENKGHGRGACVYFPDYLAAYKNGARREDLLKHDVAVLILDRKLKVRPIAAAPDIAVDTTNELVLPSYPARRRFMLGADMDCRVKKHDRYHLLTSCLAYPGSSGGPLLVKQGERYKLVGVMVAKTLKGFSLALRVGAFQGLLSKRDCQ